jgi:hypothetical protein
MRIVLCLAFAATAAAAAPVEADRTYAVELHRKLLGREPTAVELTETLQRLREAPYRIAVHNRLLDSVEFRERVPDAQLVYGLFDQLRGRQPLLHEMMIGLHFLEDGVPPSEILGGLLQPRLPVRRPAADLVRLYDGLQLDFGPQRLTGYREGARLLTGLDDDAARLRLLEESAELGGAEFGPPQPTPTSGTIDPEFNVYFGYLHAHTDVSLDAKLQGSPGPFAAFAHARDVAGLDFLGLSDHGEFISTWPWNNEWDLLQEAVDAHNDDGSFVALRGFEYSNPLYGHLNVFNTSEFTSTFSSLTLRRFYKWLAAYPEAASTFNHPGNVDWLNLEFLHLEYAPEVGEQLVGIELLTHNAEYGDYSVGYVAGDNLGYLDEALQAGWRIGGLSSQDNHQGDWGMRDDYRTGLLASSLTQKELVDALRYRRFYSTQDRNLVMSFRGNGREMGASLPGGETTFTVSLDDPDGEAFRTIELFVNGALLQSLEVAGTGSWQFRVGPQSARSYYYVVVTQADGDQAMSAPIWVEGEARRGKRERPGRNGNTSRSPTVGRDDGQAARVPARQ